MSSKFSFVQDVLVVAAVFLGHALGEQVQVGTAADLVQRFADQLAERGAGVREPALAVFADHVQRQAVDQRDVLGPRRGPGPARSAAAAAIRCSSAVSARGRRLLGLAAAGPPRLLWAVCCSTDSSRLRSAGFCFGPGRRVLLGRSLAVGDKASVLAQSLRLVQPNQPDRPPGRKPGHDAIQHRAASVSGPDRARPPRAHAAGDQRRRRDGSAATAPRPREPGRPGHGTARRPTPARYAAPPTSAARTAVRHAADRLTKTRSAEWPAWFLHARPLARLRRTEVQFALRLISVISLPARLNRTSSMNVRISSNPRPLIWPMFSGSVGSGSGTADRTPAPRPES